MGRRLENVQHLVRMAGLFALGLVLFLVLRWVFIPEGFGKLGHFRFGALADNMSRPLSFAGAGACADCHGDVLERKAAGPHKGVRCEACHGPLAKHALEDPGANKAAKPDPVLLCATCHAANAAKPAGFPQVDLKEHMEGAACGGCHDPHSPDKEPVP